MPATDKTRRRHDPERRNLASPSARIEVRRKRAGTTIVGHGAVFNSWAPIAGWFEETIRPGAFDNAILESQDVRALFNHDPNRILGRTGRPGTLRLAIDRLGLAYEIVPPDVTYARNLIVSLGRGDVSQSSFAFRVRPGGEIWTVAEGAGPDGSDVWRRELIDVDLLDVGPVTYPAYADAGAGMRHADFAAALRSLDYELVRCGLPPLPATKTMPRTMPTMTKNDRRANWLKQAIRLI